MPYSCFFEVLEARTVEGFLRISKDFDDFGGRPSTVRASKTLKKQEYVIQKYFSWKVGEENVRFPPLNVG